MDEVAGPSKRPRLLFTDQLAPRAIEQYDADGKETVEWLQYQSALRLKAKWENIFDKFQDAHLQDQDELYLGNVANGEPLVVVKDRGTLRAMDRTMNFGDFIMDQDLQGWKQRLAHSSRDQQDAPIEVLDDTDEGESGFEDESDPDLREFLQAEARRKALSTLKDDDDESIDLNDPEYLNGQVWKPAPTISRASLRARPPRTASTCSSSSSSDAEQDDAWSIYSDSDDELDEAQLLKRTNIEELLHCPTPFDTLPYNDVYGLATLLAQ